MVPDLKAREFDAAYMQLSSLEEAVAHLDRWFLAAVARPMAPHRERV